MAGNTLIMVMPEGTRTKLEKLVKKYELNRTAIIKIAITGLYSEEFEKNGK